MILPCISSANYLLTCSRYIELNPVRSGLVTKPGDYRWSSYANNAQNRRDEMITPARQYHKLGSDDKERARAYRGLFREKISDDLSREITDATFKGWVLGTPSFARKIENLSGRRATQLPKGRPRGS